MSPTLDAVRFVVDENLLRLGRALSELRYDVTCVGKEPVAELLPSGIGDTDWIPVVASRGWVMITSDKRLRTRPVEADLAVSHGLKVIHLFGAGALNSWDQTVRLASRWPGITKQLSDEPDGPWWLSVRADRVQTMRFQPGAVERI